MAGRLERDRATRSVGEYYDHSVALEEAQGGGLAYYLTGGAGHLSPMLDDDDAFALHPERWGEGITRRVLGLARRMEIIGGERVLDLGCGLGAPGRDIAGHTGCEVIGLNVSEDQMESLVAVAARSGSAYDLVVHGDMHRIPFARQTFDHAFSVNAAYHASQPDEMIAEVWRVLRPGGRFGVDDWFLAGEADALAHFELRRTWSTPDGFHRFDCFVELLRGQGFEVEDVADFTTAGGAFLSEGRFGEVYDAKIAPVLSSVFLELYPDVDACWAPVAVADLRRDILFMGTLYRSGQAVYRQIVARKPEA